MSYIGFNHPVQNQALPVNIAVAVLPGSPNWTEAHNPGSKAPQTHPVRPAHLGDQYILHHLAALMAVQMTQPPNPTGQM